MQRRTPGGTVTVPVPDHRELRIGTLQSIIRQSSLLRALSRPDLDSDSALADTVADTERTLLRGTARATDRAKLLAWG